MNKNYTLPEDLVVLISGVPGVGKTTISYELLTRYKEFRLVEETDIIREILRGYNSFLLDNNLHMNNTIYSHETFLSYNMAKKQCCLMRNSIINIVKRQKRKGIPSIINGVHIIPEELYTYLKFPNVLFINLFIDSKEELWGRLQNRDPEKYTVQYIPLIYQTNVELNSKSLTLSESNDTIYSLNISNLSINETVSKIDEVFHKLFGRKQVSG